MKGSWVTTFAAGGVIFLLTLFLGLQYNWLREAGEAQRERMQRRAETDARSFADELNREVQAAYFNFQTDSDAWKGSDWGEFNRRYDYWRSGTQYPELIRQFVYFPKGGAAPLAYDPTARQFAASEISADIQNLRSRLNDPAQFETFYVNEFALVMPVHRSEKEFDRIVLRRTATEGPPVLKMPIASGHLFIVLDRDVFTNRLLPDLVAKHFPDGDFRVSVDAGEGGRLYASGSVVGNSDVSVGMFNLTPDRMFFVGGREALQRIGAEDQNRVMVSEKLESHTFSRTEVTPSGVKEGKFTIAVQPAASATPGEAAKVRTSVVATKTNRPDLWTLNVQHAAGSLAAFARGELVKYFAIGAALYLLLVGAIVAIVLSALRSKRYAQRQIDFVSSVSHEFRTPLAVIYSAGDNLADGIAHDREQVARYGNLIKAEGRKLSAMVEQILQFAGARSGKRKYTFSAVQPSAVLREALEECGPLLEENGVEVEAVFDDDLPSVRLDREAMATALRNLISNAAKYSDGSGWVRVAASNGGGTVKFAVADRGIGVGTEDLKHIFEPFYRSRTVVDSQIHGNGLGLALVKEIAEAHGGSVRVKSTKGEGSEFTIELPAS